MGNRFCGVPFSEIAFHPDLMDQSYISVVPCCSSWIKPPYSLYVIKGKELKDNRIDVLDAWNSLEIQEFRRSIIDGSYRYCKADVCPNLKARNFKDYPQEAEEYIRANKTYLDYKPKKILICVDRACNLQCPSCRKKKTTEPSEKSYMWTMSLLESGAEKIFINGSGEFFVNKYMMKAFKEFNAEKYPGIKAIDIITNGTALNRTAWYSLSEDIRKVINDLNISVDSFDKEVYEKIRLGGDFDKLMKNLKFVKDLRESNMIPHLTLSSTLQKLNISGIANFVELAISLHADHVYLNKIENWGHYSAMYFRENFALPDNWEVTYKKEIDQAKKLIVDNNLTWVSNTITIE
jgi:pyruvate-formate lyase-activating enzyme